MKKSYPNYKKIGTGWLEEKLKGKQKQIFLDYMNVLGKTAGERKMKDYRAYFLQFMDIMQKPVYNLKPQDLHDFWALVHHDTTRTIHTKNNIRTTVKRFVKWYYKKDLEMRDTITELKNKSIIVNSKKINKQTLLTNEDLEKLLRAANNLRLKAQVITLYESAARPHELRNAKWKNINWTEKTIFLYSTKTEKPRSVPIHEAIVHLKRWKQEFQYSQVSEEDYIFPSREDRNKPIGEFMFGYWIRALGEKAKLGKNVYPYIFRHSRISELKKKGVDEDDRKLFAGHSKNSKMQGVYVHIDQDEMIESVISKVYHVEELSEEKRHELELDVERLKKAFGEFIEMHIKTEDELRELKGLPPAPRVTLVKNLK